MIITQKPQGPVRSLLGSCLPVTDFFSFEASVFPLVAVSSSRKKKNWQHIMLNCTRDIFHLPPWRSGLWAGNGPWHSYTLWFSAGPHNSHCDPCCVCQETLCSKGGVLNARHGKVIAKESSAKLIRHPCKAWHSNSKISGGLWRGEHLGIQTWDAFPISLFSSRSKSWLPEEDPHTVRDTRGPPQSPANINNPPCSR